MGKIFYYTWIGISIAIGLPIVLLILFGAWMHDTYQKLTCKNCKCKIERKIKKKNKKKLLLIWIGFIVGVLSTIGVLALSGHLNQTNMKGILSMNRDSWYVNYQRVKTVGAVKGVMGSGSKLKLTESLPIHPDDTTHLLPADIGSTISFEIVSCIPESVKNGSGTDGSTVSFTAIKYATVLSDDLNELYVPDMKTTKTKKFVPGVGKETLDELFSLHEPDDFIDEKDEELLIELEEWDHTCNDGCCYTYGTNIYINGEQLEDEDGTSQSQLLTAVLTKLGYTNVNVEYKPYGQ